MRVSLSLLLLVGVGLAGCSDDGGNSEVVEDAVNKDEFVLGANLGAIAGLLVDDRFRPIDLEESGKANGDFQTDGFVLLQETGERRLTNENGEFSFVDLEPGTYTIRVSATGHEATPQRIQVSAGSFSEISVVARRVANDQGALLTAEYSVFIPCAIDYIANGMNAPCDLDFSGDSYSSDFQSDLSNIADITWLVTEVCTNQQGSFEFQVRGSAQFATERFTGTCSIIRMEYGVIPEDHIDAEAYGPYEPWLNNGPFQTIFFVDHAQREVGETLGFCCGAGATLGVKGTFLQSVFIGTPEIDVQNYCIYCSRS